MITKGKGNQIIISFPLPSIILLPTTKWGKSTQNFIDKIKKVKYNIHIFIYQVAEGAKCAVQEIILRGKRYLHWTRDGLARGERRINWLSEQTYWTMRWSNLCG